MFRKIWRKNLYLLVGDGLVVLRRDDDSVHAQRHHRTALVLVLDRDLVGEWAQRNGVANKEREEREVVSDVNHKRRNGGHGI